MPSSSEDSKPWYVWLVAYWEHRPEELPVFRIIGIFDSYEKAREAAESGCYIACFALNDRAVGNYDINAEYIE